MTERSYIFSIDLSSDELLRIYSGSIHRVRIRTIEGLVVDLDANHLRKFTTRTGVKGRFKLVTTMENRFLRIERL